MISYYLRTLTLIMIPIFGFGQSQKTIDSLKSELKKTNRTLDRERDEITRLEYLLASKEMAIRSSEMKDSAYQALLAVQAYKFNLNHGGSTTDIDVYRALYISLKRFKDPLVVTLPYDMDKRDKELPNKLKEMADRLSSKIKRNMSLDQWNKFASNLPYEATCHFTK